MLSEPQVRKTFELLEIPLERMNESSPICIPCPFESKHNKPTKARDCQLYFADGPNLFCFHESCKEDLRELGDFVRFEVTGSARGDYPFQVFLGPKPDNTLAAQIRESREELLQKFRRKLSPAPVKISSVELLSLRFKPSDVLWIGQKFHSGSCDRNSESVAQRRYLVLESDRAGWEEQWAMLAWARAELRLKLKHVIFSGNKSAHGWFLWPGESWLREYQPALEAMGFDPNTMRKAQPVRLGGAIHLETHKWQEVLWLRK